MAEMTARALLRVEDGDPLRYRYGPASPEAARAVQLLDRLYIERRVTIITLIFSKPIDTIKDFADAFRIRKRGED